MPDVGIINEIGDMGLGFTELSDEDKAILESQENKEKEDK